jgi:hypothetical protein
MPAGWAPPDGWQPDPSWPKAPPVWSFWVADPQGLEQPDKVTTPPVESPPQPVPVAVAPPPPPPADTSAGPPTPSQSAGTAPQDGSSLVIELRERVRLLEDELASYRMGKNPGSGETSPELVELNDERVLQEVGIYRYHHPLENAQEYRERLDALQERIKDAIKKGNAVLASNMFTFDNSLAKGRRMTSDYSKLMLRAYNAEADTCVRSLRAGNVVTAKKRLGATVEVIARLGAMMEMRINPTYHDIRIEELELTSDYLMKVQEEREAARDERERLREERKAAQELEEERERLEKERAHYLNVLGALQANGNHAAVADCQAKLDELDAAIAHNDFRLNNVRAGYVYVISNPGAFGRNVVKIGMTRRLDPMDRVRELGSASVPFPFDVHALFFSADAVTLETQLHHEFADVRLNHVNDRREFFFAGPSQVRESLVAKIGNLLEFTDQPEATQYLQSRKYWPTVDGSAAFADG